MYHTPFYQCIITAPSPEARQEAARHLRYWPYVKFYKFQGSRSIVACFCLGAVKSSRQRKKLYCRSRQLVLLCLRQYGVTISRWLPMPSPLNLHYSVELFARPASTMRPFLDFIKELDTPNSLIPHPSTLIPQPSTLNPSNISNPLNF